jgi:hypothetical protein
MTITFARDVRHIRLPASAQTSWSTFVSYTAARLIRLQDLNLCPFPVFQSVTFRLPALLVKLIRAPPDFGRQFDSGASLICRLVAIPNGNIFHSNASPKS